MDILTNEVTQKDVQELLGSLIFENLRLAKQAGYYQNLVTEMKVNTLQDEGPNDLSNDGEQGDDTNDEPTT